MSARQGDSASAERSVDSFGPASSSGSFIRDALTGAYSRALFQERWPDELERARRYSSALSVCILDIDYFKNINDTFGHHRGDLILKELVHRVRMIIRSSDILFRYGGDEFLLLLPNTARDRAADVCRNILSTIEATPFPGDPPVSLAASVGVAGYPDDGENGDDLFRTADLRLYEAKRRGRNRVVHTEGGQASASRADPSRLIERDEALAAFHTFLEALPQQNHGTFIIRGQPGSGRTRLLMETAKRAMLQNYRIWPLEFEPGMAPADGRQPREILRQVVREGLPDFHRLQEEIVSYNCDGLLCTIDNAEKADPAWLRLLDCLLAAENPVRLAVVWTCAPGTYAHIGADIPHSATVELAPLTAEGTRIYLRNVLHWDPPEEFRHWLFRQTSGFPKQLHLGLEALTAKGLLSVSPSGEPEAHPEYAQFNLQDWLAKSPVQSQLRLPLPLTTFIGREEERAKIGSLMEAHRVVSLTGPGGIGKTRLALQTARSNADLFPGGVYFLPLSEVRDPSLVPAALAKSLGILESREIPLADSVRDFLRERITLLVVDNFEQVAEAAAYLQKLIGECPGLHLLATSRHPLHLQGEEMFPVPPLGLPANPERASLPELESCAAIALFIARAQSVRTDFLLTDENRAPVTELCLRLDGLPLAIELAAARIGQFSPREMLEQNSLSLLSRAPADYPLRHKTMREVVRWSVDLLRSSERGLFVALGIFHGWYSPDAAARICMPDGMEPEVFSDLLETLVENNLLQTRRDRGNCVRYRMLYPIREVAVELLARESRKAALFQRHAAFYQTLVEETAGTGAAERRADWLDVLEEDHGNWRAALEWLTREDSEAACRMAAALGPFWRIRNYWMEGRGYLKPLLASRQAPSAVGIELHLLAGQFACYDGAVPEAQAWLEKGLALCREVGLPRLAPPLLQELGWLSYSLGEREKSRMLLDQALEISRSANDPGMIADVLSNLGWWYQHETDFAHSAFFLQEGLAISRRLGHKSRISELLRRLAHAEYGLGAYEKSCEHARESLALSRELGDSSGTARTLVRLAEIARVRAEYDSAEKLLQESVDLMRHSGDRVGLSEALFSQAEFFRSRREYKKATAIYQEDLALTQSLGLRAAIARIYKDLGEMARIGGEYDLAEKHFEAAHSIYQYSKYQGEAVWLYRAMAELALTRQDPEKSRQLWKSCLGLLEDEAGMLILLLLLSGLIGIALAQQHHREGAVLAGSMEKDFLASQHLIAIDDCAEYRRRVAGLQSAMGPDEWEAAVQQGRAIPMLDAAKAFLA